MPPGVGVAYVLVDDLGRTIQLDRAATPQAAREAVQRIAASPIRDAMRSAIVDAFAFSIVVEGVDGEQNAVAHAVAAELDAAIKRYEEHLPRAIAGEMQTLVIPRSAIADERLFLWALGIDEPLNLTAPQLLITYGRAKRAGDVLLSLIHI